MSKSTTGRFEMTSTAAWFVAVTVLSALPAGLYLLGFTLESGAADYRDELFEAIGGQAQAWDYGLVKGAMAYSMLEWTVVLLAMATAALAYAHYHVRREPIALIIGVATFWAGAITAFHLLAFHGFSMQVENPSAFIKFNWTLGQGFTALLLVGASALVLWRQNQRPQFESTHLIAVVAMCSAVAYAVIFVTARAPELPSVVWGNGLISKPMDLVPLVVFAVAAVVVLPALHRMCDTIFSLALWVSVVPLMASQLYMALFSEALFDAGFTSAQLTKGLAFAIIFGGLAWDYARTCRSERHLEQRLTITDRRIRLLFNNAAEAIVMFDARGSIVAWNRRASDIYGWSPRQVQGRDIAEVLFGTGDGEMRSRRREFHRKLQHLKDNRASGDEQLCEEVIERRDGSEVTVEYTLVATTERGETIYAMLARDITERKNLQLRMYQMDRLVAAGTLAAGVVHEIKNPMTYVGTNLELAREMIGDMQSRRPDSRTDIESFGAELRETIDAAEEGSQRVQRIIDDMRVFSRTGNGKTEPVCIRETVEIAIRMTRGKIREIAEIATDFAPTARIEADVTRLSQVFVNLMLNAGQAMARQPSKDHVIEVQLAQEGDEVVVRFIDTGPGMTPEVQSRIFRPFFTTKSDGEGTGLGLTLSKTIVEEFGGEISVESAPGEGTTFEIRLPAIDETPV